MCGIAGIISAKSTKNTLEKMLLIQQHRGPDHSGIYLDEGFISLGHNRLSIIDPSAESNQPFSDPSGRYHLSFNGEIYNYVELRQELRQDYNFKTSSDTEVLLAAFIKWGKNCLEHLNGMFAFAIWDSLEKSFFAARDRFGVKPFYYTLEGSDFYFASEIKTIKSVLDRDKANLQVWANYFAHGSYGAPQETFYEGIFQLPAGHFLCISEDNFKIENWYDFVGKISEREPYPDFEEVKKKYLSLLRNSISLRFRADVQVGFNISGGLDSSLLLALVSQEKKTEKIQAYTFYTGNKAYDELPWVKKMIKHTNKPLKKIFFGADDAIEAIETACFNQDEPFGGIPTLAYSKIFEAAYQDNVKVLLDGQGMDEQWAGYDYYRDATGFTIQGQNKTTSPFKKDCLGSKMKNIAQQPLNPKPFDNQLQNLQYRDLFYTKIPRALRFNDRISMAYSTELREPFLDYRLVELAFSQPHEYKIKEGVHKFLLREIVKDMLPQEIGFAPKRPLQTPQREWLGIELKDFVGARLKILKAKDSDGWFDHKEIQKEWQSYLAGNNSSSFHIWQWVNTSFFNLC